MPCILHCVVTTKSLADELRTAEKSADEIWVIENLVVTAIDSVAVPSTIAGTIRDLAVREGQSVKKEQSLGQLEDSEAESFYLQAVAEAKIAVALAASSMAAELAEQDVALAGQAIQRQAMLVEIAEMKAASDIRVRAAEKATLVAKNELERASLARERFSDAVSQSEIDGLNLAHQRTLLEAQQAELERQLDSLTARVEQQTSIELKTALRAAELELAKSRFDQSILRLRSDSIRHQVDQAKIVVLKHRILSPSEGVVADVFRRPGEWVQPGDAILRIVKLSRLRADGFLPSERAIRLRRQSDEKVEKKRVSLHWQMATGERKSIPGVISFVSPEVDAINNQVRFWVEFDNADLNVLPGMKVGAEIDMTMGPGRP